MPKSLDYRILELARYLDNDYFLTPNLRDKYSAELAVLVEKRNVARKVYREEPRLDQNKELESRLESGTDERSSTIAIQSEHCTTKNKDTKPTTMPPPGTGTQTQEAYEGSSLLIDKTGNKKE